ncbi:hypothetical protein J7E73_10670 [Paenibacillus albidus]|uniref:hypothetical protein n=1 Tax=Paenibacillus albidus TaxID=2041023 RepID=UPI001BE86D97|nr:hypothetical protein [Paenibacillus albidus]MBT2289587.1 hypothetical protein [Paenibacillus albidus]
MEYTDEQIQAKIDEAKAHWDTEYLLPLQTEINKLKPKEATEHEQEIERLKSELYRQKVVSKFKEMGFDDFIELVHADSEEDITVKLGTLQSVLDKRKLSNSFQPNSHRQTDTYSQAKAQGDTTGMIKSLFGIN